MHIRACSEEKETRFGLTCLGEDDCLIDRIGGYEPCGLISANGSR